VRLKAACWAFAAFTAFVMLGWPAIVGMPPKARQNAATATQAEQRAHRLALKQYAVRAELWLFVLVGSFLGTTVLAALVVRQTRQEVLKLSAENLRELIEGTLQDHKKKGASNDNPS
jgi:hypothetical protein